MLLWVNMQVVKKCSLVHMDSLGLLTHLISVVNVI